MEETKEQKEIFLSDKEISFETAKILRSIGVVYLGELWYNPNGKLDGFRYYDMRNDKKDYPAPTQSLLQKWLREEHKINIEVIHNPAKGGCWMCRFKTVNVLGATYEQALESGLQHALQLIKQ